MLPARARLRGSKDFQATFRAGVRVGRPTLVIHACWLDNHNSPPDPTRVGFVVSKKVGKAVTRNLVKRRLRAVVAHQLKTGLGSTGFDIVIRALPAAAASYPQVAADVESAWPVAISRARAKFDSTTSKGSSMKTSVSAPATVELPT